MPIIAKSVKFLNSSRSSPAVKIVPHLIDTDCSSVITDIFTKFSTGVVSKNEISKELKRRKVKNYKGKILAFSQQTLDNILNNIYYTSYLKAEDGRIIKGQHEVLLT